MDWFGIARRPAPPMPMKLSVTFGDDVFELDGLEVPIDAGVIDLVKAFMTARRQTGVDSLAVKLNQQSTALADAVRRNQPK